mmetsp:Transcript_63608/g.143485  ORF Transcript_63608/g.143485 Transcript_63608/m.143485 type:complete len:423 (-) Transcript_63608:126-1394(-)|eukprot:CAMPEP_0172617530 /NCGR_PEP_ID=MMETSP1068-20121228/70307_1 /TAXON_ID=35684 /ORGANISM="Pseudopedinella elastica, Strain CCMP716" /LENGTH=422 /DNA_ID=CAMNT_0013423303 /DNA_START=187 /DNA_END=1455 /DNA_ORIENTATION=+
MNVIREAPLWLLEWRADALRRIEALRSKWRREREKLDLELETLTIEAGYSEQLSSLMEREEEAGASGNFEAREQIAVKVDEGLAAETQHHFMTQSDLNIRKLGALFHQQDLESRSFEEALTAQIVAVCRSASVGPVDEASLAERIEALANQAEAAFPKPGRFIPGSISLEAFAEEERRLWRVAQASMGDSERLHLAEALKLQLRRVDADWNAHEEQMHADYEAQRAEIEGRRVEERTLVATPSGPWKSKEKQSRLIHTAPIIQPEGTMNFASSSSDMGDLGDSEAMEVQLRQLDTAFAKAKAKVAYQKQNAVRWILRQNNRMLVQISAMERDKTFLSQHLEREEASLQTATRKVNAFTDLLVDGGNLPATLRMGHQEQTAGQPRSQGRGAIPRLALAKAKHLDHTNNSKSFFHGTTLPPLAK